MKGHNRINSIEEGTINVVGYNNTGKGFKSFSPKKKEINAVLQDAGKRGSSIRYFNLNQVGRISESTDKKKYHRKEEQFRFKN